MKLEKLKLENKSISKEAMSLASGGKMVSGTLVGECSLTASTGCFDCSGTAD